MPLWKCSRGDTVVLSASCQQTRTTPGRMGVTAICTVSAVPVMGPPAVVLVITVSDSKLSWWTQLPKCASYTWPTAGKWIVDMGSSFLLLPLRRCRNDSCSGEHNAKRQPCWDTLMFCQGFTPLICCAWAGVGYAPVLRVAKMGESPPDRPT